MAADPVDRRLLRRGVEQVLLIGQRQMGQTVQGGLEKLVALLEQVRHHEHFDGIDPERRELGPVGPPPVPPGATGDGGGNGLGQQVVPPQEDQPDPGLRQLPQVVGSFSQHLVPEVAAVNLQAEGPGAGQAGLGRAAGNEALGPKHALSQDLRLADDVGM
ncbi:MAG: hypothetical protein QOF20_622 [Acidimicrobiaceae bacterium]|nr:hypothetical protein [Acidimicrobiaceae bacterium]